MSISMEAPRTPQHDLVAMTAALRGTLMQRVEQGIQSSGLTSYYMYLVAKRLMFAGPQTAATLAGDLHQSRHVIEDNLDPMLKQGLVTREGDVWQITDAGRNAMVAANDTGSQVLDGIRAAIGAQACDQLVAGMRAAVAALRKSA